MSRQRRTSRLDPGRTHVGLTEWGASHGISRQQVHNLLKKDGFPVLTVGGKRRVPVVDANRWYVQFKAEEAIRRLVPTNEDEARARKLAAEARRAELELAKAEGELVTLDYLERQLEGLLQRLRAQLLAFPGKFAPRMAGLRSVPEAQSQLEAAIAELMGILSETGEDRTLDEEEER